MTLYEIDQKIMELIDPETGELLDVDAFDALQMERTKKIENVALWAKNLAAEAAAIKGEVETLTARKNAAERRVESLKAYLAYALNGEKFSTPRCVVSFRRTKSCVPSSGFVEWAHSHNRDDLLVYKQPEPSKTAIKAALEAGQDVPAEMVEKLSVGVR